MRPPCDRRTAAQLSNPGGLNTLPPPEHEPPGEIWCELCGAPASVVHQCASLNLDGLTVLQALCDIDTEHRGVIVDEIRQLVARERLAALDEARMLTEAREQELLDRVTEAEARVEALRGSAWR